MNYYINDSTLFKGYLNPSMIWHTCRNWPHRIVSSHLICRWFVLLFFFRVIILCCKLTGLCLLYDVSSALKMECATCKSHFEMDENSLEINWWIWIFIILCIEVCTFLEYFVVILLCIEQRVWCNYYLRGSSIR